MMWGKTAVLAIAISLLAQMSWASSVEATIAQLTKAIESAQTAVEQSRYLVYRARHYAKLEQPSMAEGDYLASLKVGPQGWVWAELAAFYAREKQYTKADRVIDHIKKNFPHFIKELTPIAEIVQAELRRRHLEENPPEIILDTAPDRSYVSRVQLRNRALAKAAANAPPQPKTTYKS